MSRFADKRIAQKQEKLTKKIEKNVKKKLKYLANKPDDEEAHLSKEEWKLLKTFLKDHRKEERVLSSAKMVEDFENGTGAESFTQIYKTVLRVGDKFIYIEDGTQRGNEIYSFKVCKQFDTKNDEKKTQLQRDIASMIENNEMTYSSIEGQSPIIFKKNQKENYLSEGLEIETLFTELHTVQEFGKVDICTTQIKEGLSALDNRRKENSKWKAK